MKEDMAMVMSFFFNLKTGDDMKLFFGYILMISFFISCTKDKGKPEPTSLKIDSCSQNITYTNHIVPIINNSCALPTCHVPTGYKDLSTYNALNTVIDVSGSNYFLSVIKPGGGMPPSYSTNPTPLNSCQISKIEAWVKDGYPNN